MSPASRSRTVRGVVIGAVALASAAGGAIAVTAISSSGGGGGTAPDAHSAHHAVESSTTAISRAALARDYGIRLNLVGVTAAGGLVDLRFTITDAAKAKRLFSSASVMPAVIDEDTGTVLQAPHGGHHGHVTPVSGASYFVLIGNAGGVVQRGVPVSVRINGVRVEHIAAES